MPETSTNPEIDDFDLHELASLAPTTPRIPGDDWAMTRAQLLDSLTVIPARRRSRIPRLLAAAAAVAAVGGLGYATLQPDGQNITPAAPAPSSSAPLAPTSQPSDDAPYLVIPDGRYLTRTFTMTQVAPLPASNGRPAQVEKTFEKRTEWISSKNVYSSTGTTGDGPTSTPEQRLPTRRLTGMPRDPKAMRAWAVKNDKVSGDTRADDRIAWEVATDLIRDMRTTPTLRRNLVAMLRANPNTTVSQGTVMGREAVTVTFRHPAHDGSPIVQTTSLDSSSMSLLRETTRGKVGTATAAVDYRLEMDTLEQVVDHKP